MKQAHTEPVSADAIRQLAGSDYQHNRLRAAALARKLPLAENPFQLLSPLLLEGGRVGKAAEQSILLLVGHSIAATKEARRKLVSSAREDGIFTGSQPGLEDTAIGRIRYLAKSKNVFMRLKAAALAPACNGEEKIDERGGPAQVIIALMKDADQRVRAAATPIAGVMLKTRPDEFSRAEARFVRAALKKTMAVAARARHNADPGPEALMEQSLGMRRLGTPQPE